MLTPVYLYALYAQHGVRTVSRREVSKLNDTSKMFKGINAN